MKRNDAQTIGLTTKRILAIERLLSPIFKSGRYSKKTATSLRHLLYHMSDDLLEILRDILAYEPSFPRGRNFREVWGLEKKGILKLSVSEEKRQEKLLKDLRPKAMRVYSLYKLKDGVPVKRSFKGWSDEKIDDWMKEYYIPACRVQEDGWDRAWKHAVSEYLENLRARLSAILMKLRQGDLVFRGIEREKSETPLNHIVKAKVEEVQNAHPGLTKNEIFIRIAAEFGKSFGSVKGLYYLKPKKKVKNKVT